MTTPQMRIWGVVPSSAATAAAAAAFSAGQGGVLGGTGVWQLARRLRRAGCLNPCLVASAISRQLFHRIRTWVQAPIPPQASGLLPDPSPAAYVRRVAAAWAASVPGCLRPPGCRRLGGISARCLRPANLTAAYVGAGQSGKGSSLRRDCSMRLRVQQLRQTEM